MVEALVYRLKGHHTSLIGVQAIEGTPQVISADIDGYFKVWDIRTFECIQTFTSNANNGELSSDLSSRPNASKTKSFQRSIESNTEGIENEAPSSQTNNSHIDESKTIVNATGSGMKGLRGFTVAAPYNQIYAGTKKLHIFEYSRPGNPQLSSDDPIVDILFNDYTNTILTASGRDIKV